MKKRKTFGKPLLEGGIIAGEPSDAPTMVKSAIGGCMYLMRDTRPEIARVAAMVASRAPIWHEDANSLITRKHAGIY